MLRINKVYYIKLNRLKYIKLCFLVTYLIFLLSTKEVNAYPLRIGLEVGLLPFSGIFSSYRFNKVISLETAIGIKIPINTKLYYYFRTGLRLHPIPKFNRFCFNISLQPSLYKYTKELNITYYKINWTNFYLDIGYSFYWGLLGLGIDIKYVNILSKKNLNIKTAIKQKGFVLRPILFINYDFVHWIKQ